MELTVNIRNLMWRYDYARCAELYAQAGFRSIDYGLDDMANDNDALSGNDYREAAENLRKIAEQNGMKINQTHAPFTFRQTQWDNQYEDLVYPRLLRSIEVSALLGAKIVVMHPLHHFVYHGHEEEIFERNMKFYRGLIPYCREYHIQVGIENMYQVDPKRRHIVFDTCATKEEYIRYIDTLDSEYMVANLDLGHVGLPLQDDEAQDLIRALGHDRLKGLHVHDNDYRGDNHALPFFGKMNWEEITKALGEIDYTGDFTYEAASGVSGNMDDDFVPTALRYTYDIGQHLIGKINAARPGNK